MGEGDEARWWSFSGKPVDDEHASGWRGVLADVTEATLAQARLLKLAHFDPLTGLANRATLREALQAAAASQRPGALMCVDLDHFKAVNDSMGHPAGDLLLQVVAERLRGCVRPDDRVARLGGDEFALLLGSVRSESEAEAVARRVVRTVVQPCQLAGRRVEVGASVGVVMLGQRGAGGRSVEEWIGNADLALYAAKASGRNRYCLFTPALAEAQRRRAAIEEGLRGAVAGGQLHLLWQPKVDLQTGQVSGAEALLRWQHPTLGVLPPAEFIALAEGSPAIDEIGQWVLHTACAEAASSLGGVAASLNVSARQLRERDWPQHVREALVRARLPAALLEVEVTEAALIDEANGALEALRALQRLGVHVALYDFGAGDSSLAHLQRFPFDTLKIDRGVVDAMVERAETSAIVQTMARLAGTLGMKPCAEGVETVAQLRARSAPAAPKLKVS